MSDNVEYFSTDKMQYCTRMDSLGGHLTPLLEDDASEGGSSMNEESNPDDIQLVKAMLALKNDGFKIRGSLNSNGFHEVRYEHHPAVEQPGFAIAKFVGDCLPCFSCNKR